MADIVRTAEGTSRDTAIDTLDRGLRILEAVSAEGTVTVDQLATTVQLPVSTVYRYVRHLRDIGYLAELDGLYSPGPRSRTGESQRDAAHLVHLANPWLRRLQRHTRLTAILTVRAELAALTLDRVLPPKHAPLSFRRGRLRPLYAGASATALLAWAPDDVVSRVVGGPMKQITVATPCGPELLADLEHIRDQGYVVSHGEVDPLMTGVAAPVLRDGACVCAVSVAGPSRRLTGSNLDNTIKSVLQATRALEAALAKRHGVQAWDAGPAQA